jgi:hypothetical protein
MDMKMVDFFSLSAPRIAMFEPDFTFQMGSLRLGEVKSIQVEVL